MKRRLLFISLCLAAASLCACSAPSGTSTSKAASPETESAPQDGEDGTIVIPTDSAAAVEEELSSGNLSDFVELGNYKGLEIEAPKDTPIENGMSVNINYSGSLNGNVYPGGTVDNYELIVGLDNIVEGFEEQLIGHKEGEHFDVTVTYPKDYGNDELAGNEVVFAVDVNKVYRNSPDIAYAMFLDSCTMKQYPQELFDKWSAVYLETYEDYVPDTSNPSKEEILEAVGMDESMFNDMVVSTLKELLVIDAVFDAEGVTRDSKEYQQTLQAYLDQYGYGSVEDALSTGLTEDYLTYCVDLKMLNSILLKYEKK